MYLDELPHLTTIKEITTQYFSREDFMLACISGLKSIPIDGLATIKYTYLHLAVARSQFLREQNQELVSYGVLWDLANFLSKFTLIKINTTAAYEELLKLYNKEPLNQASFTRIIVFDAGAPHYSEQAIEGMRSATELLGLYTPQTVSAYNLFKEYL